MGQVYSVTGFVRLLLHSFSLAADLSSQLLSCTRLIVSSAKRLVENRNPLMHSRKPWKNCRMFTNTAVLAECNGTVSTQ
jgi:hypothetical protein